MNSPGENLKKAKRQVKEAIAKRKEELRKTCEDKKHDKVNIILAIPVLAVVLLLVFSAIVEYC